MFSTFEHRSYCVRDTQMPDRPEVCQAWPVSANLDLVRSIYADWEGGDFSSAEWAHPEIDYAIADGPAPGRWRGLAKMAAAWREVLDAATDVRAEAEYYLELDGDRVLVLVHDSGRGKASGLEVGQTRAGANLFHVRDGKVTRLFVYFERERALADLGLAQKRPRDPG
jgi:ketosteroid isomerase-like protein